MGERQWHRFWLTDFDLEDSVACSAGLGGEGLSSICSGRAAGANTGAPHAAFEPEGGTWEEALQSLRLARARRERCSSRQYKQAIAACASACKWAEVLALLRQMQERRLKQDAEVHEVAVAACAEGRQWEQAVGLLRHMQELELSPSEAAYNAAVGACSAHLKAWDKWYRFPSSQGCWETVLELMREMASKQAQPTVESYDIAIQVCEGTKQPEHAAQYQRDMHKQQFRQLMSTCEQRGRWEKALAMLQAMRAHGKTPPDQEAYVAAIGACGKQGRWKRALGVLNSLREQGVTPSSAVYGAAVEVCSKHRQWESVLELQAAMRLNKLGGGAHVTWSRGSSAGRGSGAWLAKARSSLTAAPPAADPGPEEVVAPSLTDQVVHASMFTELIVLEKYISDFDVDVDGKISRDEFVESFLRAGLLADNKGSLTKEEVAGSLFDLFDADGSGILDASEVRRFLRKGWGRTLSRCLEKAATPGGSSNREPVKKSPVEAPSIETPPRDEQEELRRLLSANWSRVIDLFQCWDADASGTICKEEFRRAMTMLGVHGLTDSIVDAFFAGFDRDGSGDISYRELDRALRPQFRRARPQSVTVGGSPTSVACSSTPCSSALSSRAATPAGLPPSRPGSRASRAATPQSWSPRKQRGPSPLGLSLEERRGTLRQGHARQEPLLSELRGLQDSVRPFAPQKTTLVLEDAEIFKVGYKHKVTRMRKQEERVSRTQSAAHSWQALRHAANVVQQVRAFVPKANAKRGSLEIASNSPSVVASLEPEELCLLKELEELEVQEEALTERRQARLQPHSARFCFG